MNRRFFLKLLGLVPAAVVTAEPAIKLAYDKAARTIRPMTALEIQVLQNTHLGCRPDLNCWQIYTSVPMRDGAYEYTEMWQSSTPPDATGMAQYHERALLAFQRAQRKYG